MSDLEILKLIEKELRITLEQKSRLEFGRIDEEDVDSLEKEKANSGFVVNEKNQITSISLNACQISNLEIIVQLLKKITQLKGLILSKNDIKNLASLSQLKHLTALDLSHNQISDIAALTELTELQGLFLNNNNVSDIGSLRGLKNLTYLGLSYNQIKKISPLKELDKLNHLNLSSNKIDDIAILNQLPNLTFLDLGRTGTSNINPLKNCKKLISLNLEENSISDIEPLATLFQLTDLMLLENKIEDVSPLSNLNNLIDLNLARNKISSILPLSGLKNLSSLWLLGNPIKGHKILSEFTNLQYLSLGENNLTSISFLKDLTKLKRLDLQENRLKNISPLKNLRNLTSLNLEENNISEILGIQHLKSLEKLQLQNNPIVNLPNWITEFNMDIKWDRFNNEGKYISFFENPLNSPPAEIVKKGKKAIFRYFEKIKIEGVDFIYEAKLTLVGEGSAGKTSLQKRLLNDKAVLPRKDKRTRGIEIKDWQFLKEKGKIQIAHIWDFGGQDVYYPVHRFFITENSVFVLLASTRQTHHNFDYWIPTIYQFGNKSPIILGQTCHEGNKISWNDLGTFIGNQNFNIIKTQALPYYELNLPNKNEGLKKIRQVIINQIVSLPHYGKGVPKSWIIVRATLIEESKISACISFDRFKEICKLASPESFTKIADITDCCQFLHDIGIVLWYSGNEELKEWVILQPEWAMSAVYKIIDDDEIQKRRGNILAKDFNRLWEESFYESKHNILKRMLEIFKIAFPKKHRQQDYIIPARLLSMPSERKWKDTELFLRLEYYYEFMPRGLVNQVSAELSRYIISGEEVWNNAVNFAFDNNTAQCQIEEDFYKRKITIKANGKDARSLIILVMNTLKNITDEYKGIKPEIYVPCTCTKCRKDIRPTTFIYDKLLEWSSKRENAKAICNESGENLFIDELLYNVGLPNIGKEVKNKNERKSNKKLNLFISYSKHDVQYLNDFQDHLITLKNEGLIVFDCREIEFGKEWDKEIKQKIEDCDILACLVSVKFLNTDYITKIEIPKAIEQHKTIIPIIIKACDWENSELGKYQAAQRGKVVSLDDNLQLLGKIKSKTEEEMAGFWTSIIKELRKKIFN